MKKSVFIMLLAAVTMLSVTEPVQPAANKQIPESGIAGKLSVNGRWGINANGYPGLLIINNTYGEVTFSGYKKEILKEVAFDGKKLVFTRPVPGLPQVYTGMLKITADGKKRLEGTFTSSTTAFWSAELQQAATDTQVSKLDEELPKVVVSAEGAVSSVKKFHDQSGSFSQEIVLSVANVAENKPTAQSSTGYGGASARAVDGNTDGQYYVVSSVTCTSFQPEPWWQVDLQKAHPIREIILFNRTDCCGERLSDVFVLVSNYPFTAPLNELSRPQPGIWKYHHKGQVHQKLTIPVNQQGRYVRIQLSGTNYLSLAEVQVMADSGAIPMDETSESASMQTTSNQTQYQGVWSRSENGKVIDIIKINRSGSEYNATFHKSMDGQPYAKAKGQVESNNLIMKSVTTQNKKITIKASVDGNNLHYSSYNADGSHRWAGQFVRTAEIEQSNQEALLQQDKKSVHDPGESGLPIKILFDGDLGENWETIGVAGGNFTKFGRFENGKMIVSVPAKHYWGKTGILSKTQLLDLDYYTLSKTPYLMRFKVDPKQTSGFVVAFSGTRLADIWLERRLWVHIGDSFVYSETDTGVSKEKPENWDGNMTIVIGDGWFKVQLSEENIIEGKVNMGPGQKYYMAVFSHPPKEHDPCSLTLESITLQKKAPAGMTALQRWELIDDEYFDADEFIADLLKEQ